MKKLLSILIGISLSGCANYDSLFMRNKQMNQESPNYVKVKSIASSMNNQGNNFGSVTNMAGNQTHSFAAGGNYGGNVKKTINHYVRGIMHDLVENMQYVSHETPLAVTSFIYLDGDYNSSGLLGNQIAESFIHEIHKFGIPVVDYKTSDYIRVTRGGDYVFSRDFLELSGDAPIKYVLGGTMSKYNGGYLVNARVVGIESKAVVATAQSFIPSRVANALSDSSLNDGIPLIEGD